MAKEIIWLASARNRYRAIVEYLQTEWSEKAAEEFIEKVNDKLEVLRLFPQIGSESEQKKGLRKLILSPHNTLVYRIKGDVIILLTIYDNRQSGG
ncbi:MAG TPA: type II toxin-antitoxin system RelE/ParE family toxin [Cytophagales bacterium]|jgi:plasmid stabilization system protein ParE